MNPGQSVTNCVHQPSIRRPELCSITLLSIITQLTRHSSIVTHYALRIMHLASRISHQNSPTPGIRIRSMTRIPPLTTAIKIVAMAIAWP